MLEGLTGGDECQMFELEKVMEGGQACVGIISCTSVEG